jgi:hypothetical protein
MKKTRITGQNEIPGIHAADHAILRLLVIPLLVYISWLIEIFLLEGSLSLFRTLDPFSLILYTLAGCILVGIIVPVFLLRRSFLTGAVNLFQIGFHPFRRTIAVCTITGIACYFSLVLFNPAGLTRLSLAESFLLYLPTGIASVMICWVLIGTHLQALVRAGGALVSIPSSVVVTSILFCLTTVVHTHVTGHEDPLVPAILLGMVTALFFFSARDVYASVIVITTGMVILFSGRIDENALVGAVPLVSVCASAALAALLGIHGYFSWRYTTVIVVPDR